MGATYEPAVASIGAEVLERMARIARGMPGHVVSVATDGDPSPVSTDRRRRDSEPVLCIDGVEAERLFERYFRW